MNEFGTLLQMVSMLKNGGNPQNILNGMIANNPNARMAMQMIQGKNSNQIKQMATNMARERGTTPEQIARALGLM